MTLRNHIYYRLRPFLPQAVRFRLRHRLASRLRERHRATWPIDPAAAESPSHWAGWPENSRFAFVLTHDVESQAGLDQVEALARVEMRHGFRSSFNFVPEGPYRVPAGLRRWLERHDFEVGVHDLHHDGSLYRSRGEFPRHAARINHYLDAWDAEGFRSAFMLHELDWLHDLRIRYDASTFDTDPFEPQPEAAGTIFPFIVAGSRGRYVELPYTLPQDSTLFLVLREATPGIWLEKLDWLVARGGMALVNVHPDYLSFDSAATSTRYPVAHYEALLVHARAHLDGVGGWHALPREIARFVHSAMMPALVT